MAKKITTADTILDDISMVLQPEEQAVNKVSGEANEWWNFRAQKLLRNQAFAAGKERYVAQHDLDEAEARVLKLEAVFEDDPNDPALVAARRKIRGLQDYLMAASNIEANMLEALTSVMGERFDVKDYEAQVAEYAEKSIQRRQDYRAAQATG